MQKCPSFTNDNSQSSIPIQLQLSPVRIPTGNLTTKATPSVPKSFVGNPTTFPDYCCRFLLHLRYSWGVAPLVVSLCSSSTSMTHSDPPESAVTINQNCRSRSTGIPTQQALVFRDDSRGEALASNSYFWLIF